MINQAIGASGVVSQQCKAVVSQYGEAIMDLLLSQVKTSFTFISVFSINHG
jgi:phytepsin